MILILNDGSLGVLGVPGLIPDSLLNHLLSMYVSFDLLCGLPRTISNQLHDLNDSSKNIWTGLSWKDTYHAGISVYRSVNLFEPLNLSLAWNGIISLEIKALDVQAGEHWRHDDTTHTNRSVMTHEEPLLFFLSCSSLWRWDRYWSYRRTGPRCRERERPKHRQTERERGLGDRQT